MVRKKRQYYGFCGFHIPSFPRAPRSARGRCLHKREGEDSQICAFELLASLAGKLLQESKSSASSNASESNDRSAVGDNVIKQELDEYRRLNTDRLDHGSCEGSKFIPGLASQNSDKKHLPNESTHAESDSNLERSSIITNSDSSEKASVDVKLISKSNIKCENLPRKVEGFHDARELYDDLGGLTVENVHNSKDPMDLVMKFPAFISSDNKIKVQSCRNPVPNASILGVRNGAKLGVKHHDKNFSGFNKTTTKPKVFRAPPQIGDRRIRKLLMSKYWKTAPTLKNCEVSKLSLDGRIKPLYQKRKICYSCERYQHDIIYKRRKFSDSSLVVTCNGGFSSESLCNPPQKDMRRYKNGSATMFGGDNGVSSSVIGQQSPICSKNSHVKLSIKSFRIPELFIEIPETATVGSLKSTVVEAVTAILGHGLRVGVFIQGKKVRDDNRTLSQSGITSKENLDTLGFTLEPNLVQSPAPRCAADSPNPLTCENCELIPRLPASSSLNTGISDALSDPPALTCSANNVESNHQIISSQTDILTDKTLPESRALVPFSPVSTGALAVVPLNQKPRQSEFVQRRTRRPFSVSEVEALVKAVEELGTGRWRDVKLRSFESADHRTYVDLKDKWKTLVHTAKIAPQQRRGEPVPQELLDRVLAARAYWSQHQAKQHGKNQAAIVKITEGHSTRNEGIY